MTAYDDVLGSWQHGFRPGRGTNTAWGEILTKVVKGRYIYEFDLKGFFNNVDVTKVLDFLEYKHGLLRTFREHLERLSVMPRMSFRSDDPEDHPEDDALLDAETTPNDEMDPEQLYAMLESALDPSNEGPCIPVGKGTAGK